MAERSHWGFQPQPNDPRIKNFTEALLKHRKSHGMNQIEIAALLEISQPQYSALENGKIEPAPHKIFEIENKLNLHPGYFSKFLGYLPNDDTKSPDQQIEHIMREAKRAVDEGNAQLKEVTVLLTTIRDAQQQDRWHNQRYGK